VYTLPVIQALSQKEAKEYPELATLLASPSGLSASDLEKTLHLISESGALSRSLAFARFYEQKALGALKIFSPEQVAHLAAYVSHFLSIIPSHG
jgi:geranylgeranyl pyrophosphate synthase